jgi:hypothetical protein
VQSTDSFSVLGTTRSHPLCELDDRVWGLSITQLTSFEIEDEDLHAASTMAPAAHGVCEIDPRLRDPLRRPLGPVTSPTLGALLPAIDLRSRFGEER